MRTRLGVGAGSACLLLILPLRLEAQDAEAALLASDRAAAALSRDSGVARLAGLLEPDGVLLWPGAPVAVGPDAATRVLLALPARDTTRLTWQALGLELAEDTTLGVTWGVAVATPGETPDPPRLGRYIAAWHRAGDRWVIAALLVTGVPPITAGTAPDRSARLPPARATGPAGHFVAADLRFARLAADSGAAVAFRAWAAPDAIVSGGSGLLKRGPEAIARGVAGRAEWRWHPVAAGSSRTGDLGWTVGEAVITPEAGEPSYSKYLTVWRRPRGGPVRFLTDGGNPRPASVSPRSAPPSPVRP